MKTILMLCSTLSFFTFLGQMDHSIWTKILQENVNSKGLVNYKNIKDHPQQLNTYLEMLSKNPPTKSWSNNEKKAFWINAYNAFTVKLIIDNYPVKSIKDIAGSIYKINTPWDIRFIEIGSETYDLNNIEHSILRKDFSDPRIHFAINCASISCPVLRNEAYEASKLDRQLDDQAKVFINDTSKNNITSSKVSLSKLFSWFKGDFTESSNLIDFLNRYSNTKIKSDSKLNSLDYDWNLNKQ
jgi:hypothetical protein